MLIETKLHPPPLREGLVRRPALLRQLDVVLGGKLALVSAPAGFGKSTLLGQWAEDLRRRGAAVGWVSLDEGDDDLGRFLDYLSAAINRADPSLGATLSSLLRSSPLVPVDSVLTVLINDLSGRQDQLVLILDDSHHLTSPEIARFIEGLLTYAPPVLHLVLATRGQVPLRTGNLLVRGQIVRLDETSLRFSLEETESFLNELQDLELDPSDILFLQHRTEGWIAGLQLASLSLDGRSEREAFIRRFSGAERDIAGFLVDEVIARLPPDLLDFLLKTSILGRFSPPLAAAVTGASDGERLLRRIGAANLFLIPLDGEGVWFRYHHLFSELLRSLLARSRPEELAALHLRAAHWLARNELPADAVQHALAAGDDALAAGLVEDCCMALIRESHITRVREWLSGLPPAVLASRPRLQLAQVWVCFHMSRPRPAAKILKSARDAIADWERRGLLSDGERQQLRTELRVLTAGVASAADRSATALRIARGWPQRLPKGEAFCEGTLQNVLGFCHYSLGELEAARIACLKARDRHEVAPSVFGTVYSDLILGLVEKAAGNLQEAHRIFARAAQRAREQVGVGSYADAMVGIFEAEILYEWNDLAGAETLLTRHRQVIEECGLVVHEMACKLHVARLAAAHGRLDEALAVLENAERQGLEMRYRRLFSSALHERVKLLLARGDVRAARLALRARGLDEARVTGSRAAVPAQELEHMAFARLQIAENRPEAALRVLAPLAERLRRDERLRRLGQVRVLEATASYRAGDALSALAAIVDVVALCAPQGALRSLIDEGEAAQELLAFGREHVASWSDDGEAGRFVGLVLAERRGRPASPVTRRLRSQAPQFSSRETEVIRLLSHGHSNRDLARTLAVAPDTVKWHLKNIFGKLGVSNRTQAVLRLQELGLAERASGTPGALPR
ncbi:LuxR family transcriptional regulator, maltose regulon positive regulatory protein [Tistlia consotensis]|uniref:LuxR family transcriptional regulator, maltose regulon positive regulatory protein n=1 Tax=Tistlia consotensis USBA 355 TaxID=560819 RepID=A0A1Y6CDK9_9PROT|nr:LuxR C-terminal-related transcriptional regulator [Tistlia consotensis]SMF55781.1 LuxR family transcriptional regulator, maltose regulon positive regulatory protein [Tistlia consotensis USBA 355]SNR89279.1 LuxR family transcriptional regulator, maltose regulon positive regulatory protein [Tistlia consotensis]